MIRIELINGRSSLLESVIKLADQNSSTLGFLPREAFIEQANKSRILVALDEDYRVVGYLLYGTNQKANLIYITHLCVDQSHRGNGIARRLFEQLKSSTRRVYKGVRVRCRQDYSVNRLWPKLGFTWVNEISGRSKAGSRLTVWWFDYEHPSLFTYAASLQTEDKLKVVIDANVFYDLVSDTLASNQLSKSLLADWLDIDLCLTNEIYSEIDRNEDAAKREDARACVAEFIVLDSPNTKTQSTIDTLRDLFPQEMSESDWSDFRQIAKTIAAEVQFFITRDKDLLKKSDEIYDRYGMSIITPTDLIIHQDSLMRETEYQPSRLAGSLIKKSRVTSQQEDFLYKHFHFDEESKAEFKIKVQPYLADPHGFEVTLIQDKDNPLAIVVYSRQNKNSLDILFLRAKSGTFALTLIRHLIHQAVSLSVEEGRQITRFTDESLSVSIRSALEESEFVLVDQFWVKVNLVIVSSVKVSEGQLILSGQVNNEVNKYFQQLTQVLEVNTISSLNNQALLQLERMLWPAKFTNLNLPTYIISIGSQWAIDMFDSNLADQTLFGADPSLIFNIENVYYRSSRTKLSAPSRILWYVNKQKNNPFGTQTIRACSYLDEVVIDKPKILFSKFKRLGVYKWEDIYEITGKNIDKELMAFRFSHTELFKRPIHRDDLQKYWQETKGKNFNVQSPLLITNDEFLHLYRKGLEIDN